MNIQEKLEKITLNSFDSPALFLVDLNITDSKGPQKVKILIDSDEGLNIDACAKISRKISAAIEEDELFTKNFVLEVSSPGIDYPLKFKRQYQKNIGRKIKVVCNDLEEIEGKLIAVETDSILVGKEEKIKKNKVIKETEISFSEIKKSIVLVTFK